MTTILYKDGIIAMDTQVTAQTNGDPIGHNYKMIKYQYFPLEGKIICVAGTSKILYTSDAYMLTQITHYSRNEYKLKMKNSWCSIDSSESDGTILIYDIENDIIDVWHRQVKLNFFRTTATRYLKRIYKTDDPEYICMGSGQDIVEKAVEVGKQNNIDLSAIDLVKIASEFDESTGGEVVYIDCNEYKNLNKWSSPSNNIIQDARKVVL